MKTYHNTVWCIGLWSFIIHFSVCTSIIQPTIPALKRSLPQIKLVSYEDTDINSKVRADPNFTTLHQFENELLSKNGSDYVLRPGLRFVAFECKAKYPVLWTVPYPEQINLEKRYSFIFSEYRSSIPTFGKPRNIAFYAWFRFYNDGQFSTSANFTCIAADPKNFFLKSSIYIIKRGSNAIENQGEVLKVLVSYNSSSKDDQFMIPCRPALPEVKVKLEKQAENLTSYTELQLSPYLSFDPKNGFRMSKRLFGNKLFGMYRCKVSKNDYPTKENVEDGEDYVYVNINVTNSNLDTDSGKIDQSESKQFKTYTSKVGNAEVIISNGSVVCCSGVSEIIPAILSQYCFSAGDCHFAKTLFLEMIKKINHYGWGMEGIFKERNDCGTASPQRGTFSNLVYCKGGNLEFVDNYFPAFCPNVQHVESRLNETNAFIYYNTETAILAERVESKVFISVGTLEKGEGPDGDRKGIYLYEEYELKDLPTNHLTVHNDYVHIEEFDRSHYYEGENLTFTCLAVKFFYTAGIQMQLKWRNGTVTNFVRPIFDSDVGVFLEGDTSNPMPEFRFYYFFNEPIQADLDMQSVNCYVPQWNTSKWDVRKYDLDIRTPVLPIVEVEVESVNFDLMDSDVQILFYVRGGQPNPKKISVFMDDKLIAKSTGNIRNVEESQQFFEDVVDSQGVFKDQTVESSENGFRSSASIANVTIIEESVGVGSEDASFVIKITFPNVTHDIQGTYRCVAESIRGNVTKDVYVFVSERKSKAAWVILIFVAVLGILLVCIGVCYKIQHKTVRMLRFGIRRLN